MNFIQVSHVSTCGEIPLMKVVKSHGVVRGIVVRSRSVVGNFIGGLQTLFGGNISIYSELCESAREEAYQLMVQHAAQMGANGILCMRYDATEVMPGCTEVLAYGTAVTLEALLPQK